MVTGNFFAGGGLQFYDVLTNGYWHARSLSYTSQYFVYLIKWCRMPGDLVFIFLGAAPMVIAALLTYRSLVKTRMSHVKS